MRRYALVLVLICLFAWTLPAQTYEPAPDGVVGTPYTWEFFPEFSQLETLLGQYPEIQFSFSFALGSGQLPPGLSITNGTVSGTPTAAGNYSFIINWTFSLSVTGYGQVANETIPLPGSINITGYAGPALSVAPGALSFSFMSGASTPVSQSISLNNRSQQTQTFSASASTATGANWLSVSPSGGSAGFGTTALTVTVNPSGLVPGTYAGNVSVGFGTQSVGVAVLVTVTSSQATFQLSQTGLRFQAVAQGGTPPSQTLAVFNGGGGTLNYAAKVSTSSGGSWLSVTPSSGTAPGTLTVSVNPAGLTAGDYYGQVQISAAGAANSPQSVSVVLNVAPVGTDIGLFVRPTGLIFVGQAGGSNPAVQNVSITNPAPKAVSFAATPSYSQGSSWLSVQSSSSSVSSTTPVTLQVQPTITGLAAGVYLADIVLYFSDGDIHHVGVVLVLTPSVGGSSTSLMSPLAAGSCTPTKLVPVFTQLGGGFATVAAWPTAIEATVVDDCGNLMNSGSVIASFSSGDPALSLLNIQNGKWSATWQPVNSASQVTVTVQAREISPAVQGTASIGGSLKTNPTTPSIGAVVAAAGNPPNQPIAPGSYISIYGSNLAAGLNTSQTLPYSTQLGATQVIMAGEQLPLQFVTTNQVNAVIPYDIAPNTTQQIIVTNGPAISVPQSVVIATGQPAVYTSDGTPTGPGIVVGVKASDGSQYVVDANHPLTAGDGVVIYCTGLGAVDPAVPAGSAVPLSPLSHTVTPVSVTIGGQQAQVLFAGLTPTYVGLYQVNAIVPTGVTVGSQVPLVVTQGNLPSTAVTVAVH